MPKEEVQETDQIGYRNRDERNRNEGDRREVKPGYQDQGRKRWWGQESQKQGCPGQHSTVQAGDLFWSCCAVTALGGGLGAGEAKE